MKRICACSRMAREHLKGFMYSPAFWSLWVMAAAITGWGIQRYTHGEGSFSHALVGAHSGISVYLLAMLLWGLSLVRRSQETNIEELYASFPHGRGIRAAGEISAMAILLLVTTLSLWSGYTALCLWAGATWGWIWLSTKAIILYVLLPLASCAYMGMCIGRWVKNKSAYGIAFLIWGIVGFQPDMLFGYLRVATGMEYGLIEQFGSVMNLGIPGGGKYLFDSMEGYPLGYHWWIIRIFYAVWPLVLYVSGVWHDNCTMKFGKKQRNWLLPAMACAVLVGFLCLGSFCGAPIYYSLGNGMNDLIYTQYYEGMMGGQKEQGYSALLGELNVPRDDNMTVVKEDIDVKAGMGGIAVDVCMTLKAEKDMQGQIFTLYQGFELIQVECNGYEADYMRDREALWVDFGKKVLQGEIIEMHMAYRGNSAPNFPANETTVQLHNRFAWLPWPGMRESNEKIDVTPTFMMMKEEQISDPVMFTLRYSGPANVFCNLDLGEDGIYRGISSNGIILYSGMKTYHTKQGRTIYLPLAGYNTTPGFLDRYDAVIRYEEELNQAIKTQFAWLTREVEQVRESEAILTIAIIQDRAGAFFSDNNYEKVGIDAAIYQYAAIGQDAQLQMIMDRGEVKAPYDQETYNEMLSRVLANINEQERFFHTLLREYCCYREQYTSYSEMKSNIFMHLSQQAGALEDEVGRLADAIYETPREETDAFFAEWYKEVMAGYSREYQNLDDITEAMTGVRPVDEKEEPTGMRPEGY